MKKGIEVKCFIPVGCSEDEKSLFKGKDIRIISGDGICRYYGIYVDDVQVGEALYSIVFNNKTFELDNIEIDSKYQENGYGSILLNESINDLLRDFPYLERVNVSSLPYVKKFYLSNGFKEYDGDNLMKLFSSKRTTINGEEITTQWYQNNALRTLNNFKDRDTLKLNAYMGIIGEYGEFFDYIKKLYTHDLNKEKKEEVCTLAPKELGDVVWYLVTSLALYYDYSMDDLYDQITGGEKKSEDGYDIDSIYDYISLDFNKDRILEEMMKFKAVLNKLDTCEEREDVIKVVAEILSNIARIMKCLFNKNLSEMLYLNIDKLRKRYPEGFSTVVSNYRIDTQKKYKEEDSMKVLKKSQIEDTGKKIVI